MKAIAVPQTASYDVNLANEVGLPAAILYNQLLYTMQTDMAEEYMAQNDGYFFYTAKRFEMMAGFKGNAYTQAVKTLVKAGYFEVKKRFIQGTARPTNHFRFLSHHGNACLSDNETVSLSDQESIIENKKENIVSFPPKAEKLPQSPTVSVGSPQTGSEGGVVKITTPFGGSPTQVVDVRRNSTTPKSFALAKELMAIINPREKDVVTVARNIKALLTKGYSEYDLRQVAKASRTDDFYKDKSCAAVLSTQGVASLLAKTKKKAERVPVGIRRDGSYYKMIGDTQITITAEEYKALKGA